MQNTPLDNVPRQSPFLGEGAGGPSSEVMSKPSSVGVHGLSQPILAHFDHLGFFGALLSVVWSAMVCGGYRREGVEKGDDD